MSKRSKLFKKHNIKNINDQNEIFIKEKNDHSNEQKIKEYLSQNEYGYDILANIFCNFIGLRKEDLTNFLIHTINENPTIFTEKYVIKDIKSYNKENESLSKAFKAGEDKEYNRHIKEEEAAFKRGVKYGREQRENELKHKENVTNKLNYNKSFVKNEKKLNDLNYIFNNIDDFIDVLNSLMKKSF